MKKIIYFLLIITFLFIITSCSATQTAQTSNFIEIENEQESEILTEETIKEVAIHGETLTAIFEKAQKAEGGQIHDRLIYTTSEGVHLEYDAVTDDLVFLSRTMYLYSKDDDFNDFSHISEEEAIKIANEFFETQCDISKYSFFECDYKESGGKYYIYYNLVLNGYKTAEGVHAVVTNSGEIQSYFRTSNVFEGIEMKPINEEKLKKELDKRVKASFVDNLVDYEIKNMTLCANKEKQLFMSITVHVDFKGIADGVEDISTTGRVYEIII